MSKIIAGNWKMNGTKEQLREMHSVLNNINTQNTVILCPPFTLLNLYSSTNFAFGAQDCSMFDNGTYTGDISAKMVAEAGSKYVIVGHSDRRANHGETNETTALKAIKAIENNLIPIICFGENSAQYESGQSFEVVDDQVRKSIPNMPGEIIIAYEPVWAISAGKVVTGKDDRVATVEYISKMHNFIAGILSDIGRAGTAILYGGSVKGSNAAEIMSIGNVDGVLVGGASLKPEDFVAIINAV
jgi:triosephosphate isomerase